MPVNHLVVHADAAVGQVHAKFVAELTGDDHRLGHHFARERVDFTGVDDLVVNGHDRSADEVEPVGVVGHRQSEMVVAWNRRARIPCTLDAKVAHVQGLTALVGQGLLEAEDDVHWTEPVRQERLGVGTQQGRIEWRDVRLQTADGLLDLQPIAVDVPVGGTVAVAIVEAQVRTVGFHLGQGDHTSVGCERGHNLSVEGALEVRAFEDDVHQTAERCFRT